MSEPVSKRIEGKDSELRRVYGELFKATALISAISDALALGPTQCITCGRIRRMVESWKEATDEDI